MASESFGFQPATDGVLTLPPKLDSVNSPGRKASSYLLTGDALSEWGCPALEIRSSSLALAARATAEVVHPVWRDASAAG